MKTWLKILSSAGSLLKNKELVQMLTPHDVTLNKYKHLSSIFEMVSCYFALHSPKRWLGDWIRLFCCCYFKRVSSKYQFSWNCNCSCQ